MGRARIRAWAVVAVGAFVGFAVGAEGHASRAQEGVSSTRGQAGPQTLTCPESTIEILIQTDANGFETFWEVYDVDTGSPIAFGGPYPSNTLVTEEVCVPPTGCFDFYIYDEGNNGLCCDSGFGYYEVFFDGSPVGFGDQFGGFDVVTGIGNGCGSGAIGACCTPDGFCFVGTEFECADFEGNFAGPDTLCESGIQLFPGQGVSFYRLDITYPSATWLQSDYGLAVANYDAIYQSTGLTSGFVNVATDRGWVVRNLPYELANEYGGLSVMFDLGPYTGLSEVNAYVAISPTPVICFGGFASTVFDVGVRVNNAQGSHVERTTPVVASVDLTPIVYFPGETFGHWQPGHPSVEQDTNQCGPAAVANSLQWMKDKYGIDIKDDHEPGIRDDSLVGELDKDMQRPAHQPVASAVNFVDGKLKYIDDEDLEDEVHVKHKQRNGINWISSDRSVGDAKSHYNNDPDVSFIDWLIHEVQSGEDVELRIGWVGGGGHYICLTGAGKILGVPWISWVHDADQGHDANGTDENGGVSADDGGHGFSFIDGNEIVCYIEGNSSRATIDYAVSESPIYPKNQASQYTATMYEHSGGSGTIKEGGKYDDLYDDPTWENDTTLRIDNVHVSTFYKTVHVNIVYKTEQTDVPNVTIETSDGVAPLRTSHEWRDFGTNLLLTFDLQEQVAWEKIIFPDASFRAMTNIDRIGVATYCQYKPDCNNNGIDDRLEIEDGTVPDTNGNGVPDGCDFNDCNSNGLPDIEDIEFLDEPDCDSNGVPDDCDLWATPGRDCNNNGLLDSCETDGVGAADDCNGNRIPDDCDIASGDSADENGNGVPDECEEVGPVPCPGDSNCDGFINFRDIDYFVAAQNDNFAAWAALFDGTPPCDFANNDANGDGFVNFRDIDPFVALQNTTCP